MDKGSVTHHCLLNNSRVKQPLLSQMLELYSQPWQILVNQQMHPVTLHKCLQLRASCQIRHSQAHRMRAMLRHNHLYQYLTLQCKA